MKITLISIPVRDQEKALKFYTDKLGFIKKKDTPLEGGNRWLTVVSKEAEDGPEILLEPAPNHLEPSKVFQDAFIHNGDFLRRDAVVVESVMSVQIDPVNALAGRVIDYGDKVRKNRLV